VLRLFERIYGSGAQRHSAAGTAAVLYWAADCPLGMRGKNMPLINIVVALIVVGVALYLINRYIPMASSIKSILNIVVVCFVAVWVLQAVGLWGNISSYRVGR
jgi:hypothetical protein